MAGALAHRTILVLLVLLAVVALGVGLLAFRTRTGRYPWQPGPREISLVPNDVCGFIGTNELRSVVPDATFTTEQATEPGGTATCTASTTAPRRQVVLAIRRFTDTKSTKAEDQASAAFDTQCETYDGRWQRTNPDAPNLPAVPAPRLGQRVCGEPGPFTELTVQQGYDLITIRLSWDRVDEWRTLPGKATGLAGHTLQRLGTLDQ